MNPLDDETLVWDTKQSEFVSKQDDADESHWLPVSESRGRSEFLYHFDKAENQLFNISSELFSITLKISTLPEPEDVSALRRQLVGLINDIKIKGADLTYPVAVIDKLCFLYAVVLDELIIYTSWGEFRGWENKTLLSELFGMRNGGELFFTVSEKAIRQPHKMIDLLEVIYAFVNIGFKGQYRETGNEQLKIFTQQLQQVLGKYRPTSNIFCHTRAKLPKSRKPTRRKRYLATTVFFSCLIATSIALTHFWYEKSYDQRARDFEKLPNFSNRYIMSGEVKDIIFVSKNLKLDSESMQKEPLIVSPDAKQNDSKSQTAALLVQLATFSTQDNADKFISKLPSSKYSPKVEQIGSYFRVIVESNSTQEAYQIKLWYTEKEQLKPIVVRNTRTDDKKLGDYDIDSK
ncbi:type IVB secretion system protein IcmH/DotU [Vibrio caribbeanicus]|uniref:type IVB secretion system protein IcmH/DotU n=1 Tax=Vibrio caribbeanicus TaxID=701175 RepID=UPI0030DC98F5